MSYMAASRRSCLRGAFAVPLIYPFRRPQSAVELSMYRTALQLYHNWLNSWKAIRIASTSLTLIQAVLSSGSTAIITAQASRRYKAQSYQKASIFNNLKQKRLRPASKASITTCTSGLAALLRKRTLLNYSSRSLYYLRSSIRSASSWRWLAQAIGGKAAININSRRSWVLPRSTTCVQKLRQLVSNYTSVSVRLPLLSILATAQKTQSFLSIGSLASIASLLISTPRTITQVPYLSLKLFHRILSPFIIAWQTILKRS